MEKKRDTRITVDLLEHKQAWLDYCESHGTTPSAAFRQIVQSLLRAQPEAPSLTIVDHEPEKATVRKKISLTPSEVEQIEAVASAEGFSSSRWIVALIRARLTGTPQPGQQELEALARSNWQLLRIGRNLNQIAKALNSSPHDRTVYRIELIEETDALIREHAKVVSDLMTANIARWRIK
ncbi:MobC family plasmid mobilization relaxosome protein [Ralstonia solanacearum]|uniref:plasmid mobilization protein n=1 Tax=Ralstonia solanacearum TaxID=305 RepID=UPI002305BD16|nr:plasmid mobilization relaxosome protein MobC [Ralstonia solanacearum]MDB0516273.1 MobC family plasmid mobilization relaxosome protein [Ralstonia solanacearum]